ncbi:MAG TPA: hypothetical protein VJ931_10290, partial [Actinomycetota bacterium]|nr:hypothetical protein [Actinomycetota bacterium]
RRSWCSHRCARPVATCRALTRWWSGHASLIEECTDPGMLPVLLEETGRALGSGPRGRVEAAAPLTERELAVLFRLARRQEVIDGGVDLLRAGCPAGQGSRHGRREQEKERAGQ